MSEGETTNAVFDIMADVIGCKPSELGNEWKELAAAFSGVLHSPLYPLVDHAAIGRLVVAIVRLP